MAGSDILLRVQELGGVWQPIGVDHSRGIWVDPANFSADADAWGSRQLQSQLRYDPRVLQPHISAFTPWELEIGGVPYASGRISETPSQDGDDRSITVTGEGWQYHLDDDAYQRVYVHTNMSDWQDIRQSLSSDLTRFKAAASVTGDAQGLPSLSWPAGAAVAGSGNDLVGVLLDLGPDSTAARMVLSWQAFGASSASHGVAVYGGDTIANVLTDLALNFTLGSGTSGTNAGTFATPRRYIVILLQWTGAAGTFTDSNYAGVRITGAQTFASTAYESGNASILVGSTIVQDAIARATILLSSDQTQITPTTFQLPEYAMSAYQSPRDVATSALSFDDVIPRITVAKQLSIRPRPQLPMYEIGDWSGAQFQDASTNSGDEIYNSVVVTGTDATGAPIVVRRSQVPAYFTPSAIQPSNPSATVNTTGWTAIFGSISRDTGTFDTTPASIKSTGASFSTLVEMASWTGGTFVPGQTYQLTFRYQTTNSSPWSAVVQDANGATLATVSLATAFGSFLTGSITFVPQTSGSPVFAFGGNSAVSAPVTWIDSLSLSQGAATLVDRRGFRKTYRMDTNMSLTTAAAAALGDVYLASHRNTPFKGTLNLTGPGSIRRIRGGQSVTMGELLCNTGELIQFSHLVDPDTGGLGRYGRIASASISGPWTASVQIDSTNDNLQALLNRFQVNAAQVR